MKKKYVVPQYRQLPLKLHLLVSGSVEILKVEENIAVEEEDNEEFML